MSGLGLNVLVADDHPVNRFLIRETLEAVGCQVTLVEDGRQAVEAAANQNFDVILLDVRMPVLDGCSAARQIAQSDKCPPIIMLTADETSLDRCAAAEGVFQGCIEKPLTIDKFLASLSKAAA